MKNVKKMSFCSQSVPGGWQTGISFCAGITFAPEVIYLIGPIFNSTSELWDWQKINLPDYTEETA